MLYSNENFFITHIDAKTVQSKGYDLWVANYNEQPAKVRIKSGSIPLMDRLTESAPSGH
jgi:hypothetical protein